MSALLVKCGTQRARHTLTALSLQHDFTVSGALRGTEGALRGTEGALRRTEGGGGRLFRCHYFHVLRTVLYLSVVLQEEEGEWVTGRRKI